MTQEDTSVWCFSSSSDERVKIKVLGEDSAHFFLAMLSPDEQATWFIQKNDQPPEFIAHNTLFTSTPKEKASIQDSIKIIREEKREAERRKHFRLDCTISIQFHKNDINFTTETVNLSAGGALLKQPVPESLPFNYCTVTLKDEKSKLDISFEARILSANNDKKRVIFHGISFAASKEILKWIETQKKIDW